ncbi:peptidase E [mine drainage metagenome]|uniref:Peptidase E n=1 Tax=mine drainage metagenome TaxID=410659 RepID=A0A1J5PRZ7_9ZZZZ
MAGMGGVFLGGGGSVEDESALWSEFVKDGQRILYWPMALPTREHAFAERWLLGSLAPRGSFDVVMWSSVAGHGPEEMVGFDLVFIGGGNTYALLNDLQRHEFLEPTRQFVANGGSLYGGSAGAVLAGADISTAEPFDSNDVDLKDTSALNLLFGAVLQPHYEPSHDERLQNYAAETLTTVIAVPERCGLVVRDGQARNVAPATVAIFGPGAVHFRSAGEAWNL